MSVPATAKEKTNKKNDVKARSLLLMSFPNEHQLTFSQYNDDKIMFAVIETRFGGNKATKKTQKAFLKQQYENFNASSTESLDSIFNRLQKLVSRLAILGVVITQEDLISKFLRSLPPEWSTHVVVWMNKADIETMSIDDLYSNIKIIEQDIKKYVGASTGAQNMTFMTTLSTSSTNDVNTANSNYDVSTGSSNVNTASSPVSTANIKQIHEDDLEAIDLKWQLSLLSMRAKRYYQRTGKKFFINVNHTVGYDKSKVECFNYHKTGYFASECRAPRNKDGQYRYQDNTRKQGNNEDTSSKAILVIDGVDKLLESQITNNSKKDLGYHVVAPPHPLTLNAPTKLDFSYSGLDEFKEPEFKGYGPRDTMLKSTINSKENTDDSLVKEQVSKDENSYVESPLNVDKETIFHAAKKRESEKLEWSEVQSTRKKRTVTGNNYNRVDYDYYAKTSHPSTNRHMIARAVLLKYSLTPLSTARPVYTSHPKPTVHSARSTSHFSKQAQSTVHRPFHKKTTLTNIYFNQKVNTVRPRVVNTARPYTTPVNTVREKGVNVVKT
ncbi:hypothetical protein Tco_0383179 [Tanacetum coccineum]